jgi:hypothetical protein
MSAANPVVLTSDPGPDPVTGIDPWPSTQNAINNSAIQAKNLAAISNANLLTIYMNAFNSWAQSVNMGRIDNTNPPQPPLAWVVIVNPTTGMANATIGTETVCPMPPIPPSRLDPVPPPPNTIDIGSVIQGGPYFSVGPMDSWPVGKATPPNAKSADGVTGTFLRLGSPLGPGWYEKVG